MIPDIIFMLKIVQNSDFLTLANESSVIIALSQDSSVLDLRQTIIGLTNQSTNSFRFFAQHDTELTDNVSFKKLQPYFRPGIYIFEVREDRDGFHIYVKTEMTRKRLMMTGLNDNNSILDLKRQIQNQVEVPLDEQITKFSSNRLEMKMILRLEDDHLQMEYQFSGVSFKFHM